MKYLKAKQLVKEQCQKYKESYDFYSELLDFIRLNEGKNYDGHFLNRLKKHYKDSTFNIYFRHVASMQYLEFYEKESRTKEYSFLLNHGNREIIASEFERLNTCYVADHRRYLDGRQLLQNPDDLKRYVRNMNKIKELEKENKELASWSKPLDSYEYLLKNGDGNEI